MNKPIIIDGVDVSECDYVLNNSLKGKQHCPNKAMPYAKETSCIECKTNSTRYNFCKHNPNCYFKQLQHLKEENERLKAECMQMVNENYASTDWRELEKLKKENEELKAVNQVLIKELQHFEDIIIKDEVLKDV